MAAFVLGNGVSRRSMDVNLLLSIGNVYGCNALYRTHTPTALVATDKPISEQIQNSGYPKTNRFYTRRPMPDTGALSVPQKYFGFSSGPIACSVAALDGCNRIYLLGFDMGPNETGKFNNIYADTEFYKKASAAPTYTGNWVKQLLTVMKDFPNQQFIRVHGETTTDIKELVTAANYKKLDYSDLIFKINNPKEL
jgi:hypothetical protein